ncbi:Type IV pilus assembly protein PilC [Geodia barretti]|uniref:Type IV pilus assembly protein PilC n=1 Tax=Geodia barretti TaxID=519541 RepID=A0AA35S687_GEOBA|nr:Type IV pilus assembly protein PilC [Geodia barretti]
MPILSRGGRPLPTVCVTLPCTPRSPFVALVAAALLVTYSLPSLSSLLSEVSGDLPTSTRVLITVSDFFGEYGTPILVGLAVFALLLLVALRRDRPGRHGYGATSRSCHRQGHRSQQHVLAHVHNVDAAQSGYVPGRGSQADAEGMANAYYRRRLGRVIDRATEGTKLGEAVGEDGGFPSIVSQAIITGETRGRLADTMSGLTEYYEEVTKRAAGGITELIQPRSSCSWPAW